MAKEDPIGFQGTVSGLLPDAMARAVLAGERVDVEMTPCDLGKGRTTVRCK